MLLPNLSPPVEGVHHQSDAVDAYISNRCIGSGTLYIAESHLTWNKANSTEGISLEYPHIAVHAISRDTASFQHPCLYLMLDINIDDTVNNEQSDSDEDGDNENSNMTEVRFVPSDPFLLEPMYKSLNDCQVLHPDPEQQSDDGLGEEDEDEGHYDVVEEGDEADSGAYEENMEDGLAEPSFNGHSNDDDEMQTGQFDDAERR